MAKKIGTKDIFEETDIFKGIRDSAQQTITLLNKLRSEVEGTASSLKKGFGNTKIDSVQTIEKLVKTQEKANKLKIQAIEIDKKKAQAEKNQATAEREILRIEEQRTRNRKADIQLKSAESRENERLRKQREKQAKVIKDENDAYKKLVKSTRDLKNESKRLGAELLNLEKEGKRNTKEFRELEKQYNRVTKSAQKGDAQLKKLDKTVGDNFRNVGNYNSAIATLRNGLGQLGLAFGIGTIVRTGAEEVINFNQAVADLSAITGASGQDLEAYKKSANEMGIEVEGGASAVIEAFKLIGSAKPELLSNSDALIELTESAVLLSQASGQTLPEASKNLTDAMNQFGASSDEAGKFIDVLASGSKFGSAEIPKITEALLKFGAIAKSSNVNIQESTALIELLAENGQKGAEAGTKLRNVLLKLASPDALPKEAQESLKELGISFETLSDETIPFEQRLQELTPLLEDNTAMTKVFGVENVVAGQIILDNTDRLAELTKQMDTNGVAQEQANKRTNTLGHALMNLKNSFLGLFTSMGDGQGSMQFFIDGIKSIATNLPQIASLLFKVVRAYVLYRASLVAINVAQKVYSLGLKGIGKELVKNIPMTKAYRVEKEKLAEATESGATASRSFGKALAGIGLTMAIGLVVELAMAWWDVASGTAEARRQQDKLNSVRENFDKSDLGLQLNEETKAIEENMTALEQSIRLRKAQGEDEKQLNKELAEGRLKLSNDLVASLSDELRQRKAVKEQVEDEVDFVNEMILITGARRKDGSKQTQQQTKDEIASLKILAKARGVALETDAMGMFLPQKTRKSVAFSQKMQIEQNVVAIEKYGEALDNAKKQQKELNVQLAENNAEEKDYSINRTSSNSSLNKTIETTKVYNTELNETNKFLSKQFELLQKLKVIEQDRRLIELDKQMDTERQKQIDAIQSGGSFDPERFKQLAKQRTDLEIEFINQRATFEKEALERSLTQKEDAEQKALEKNRDNLLELAKEDEEAQDEINANFSIKEQELIDEQQKRREDQVLQNNIIDEKAMNERLKVTEEGLATIEEMETEGQEKIDSMQIDRTKETYSQINSLVQQSADFFIQQSQRKIAQLDEEINKAQQNYDMFKTLAENGNIDAKESLAEQQKIIDEANRKKMEEEKKQQRIRLAESVFNTYNSKVQQNSENPLAETIKDMSLLFQFINSLPAFYDGTEDTGKNGQGVDGKGGFHAILHPNERVVPKNLNDKIGNITNEELTNLAVDYKNGKVIELSHRTTKNNDISTLVNELNDIKETIANKPETNIELGEITSSVMEIVKKTKKGNSITFNRYKTRK